MPSEHDLESTRFFSESRRAARDWFFQALPLWWERGADHAGGGFHETLTPDGQPAGPPARLRVQARQVFVYARAGELGWDGPWHEAMHHGLNFITARYQRTDGCFRSTLAPEDEQVDLYDQAFVLLALALAWRHAPDDQRLLDTALRLMARLDDEFRVELALPADTARARPAHQGHVYRAWRQVPAGELPWRSNPLMHLLEALLAWAATDGAPGVFARNARAIAELGLARLLQPAQGGVGELYHPEWTLAADLFEPGHQFEWSFLLCEADRVLGGLPGAWPAALRLARFGNDLGIDPMRNVAFFSMDGAGKPQDSKARLWAQTERLRTATFMARQTTRPAGAAALTLQDARRAWDSLQRFLDVPRAGLWREWMREDGRFVTDAPLPASSLYHLTTGFDGLLMDPAPASPSRPR